MPGNYTEKASKSLWHWDKWESMFTGRENVVWEWSFFLINACQMALTLSERPIFLLELLQYIASYIYDAFTLKVNAIIRIAHNT